MLQTLLKSINLEISKSLTNTWISIAQSKLKAINNIFKTIIQGLNKDRIEDFELIIDRQKQEIAKLNNVVNSYQGEYVVINGERKYSIEEDRGVFEDIRHRNLTGLFLKELREAGLDAVRTIDKDPLGDIEYSTEDATLEQAAADKAILKTVCDKLQAKYNPNKK